MQFDAAIAYLEIVVNTLETNAPINEAEGNILQATTERENAEQISKTVLFLKANTHTGNFKDRLVLESAELNEKVNKLKAFVEGPDFHMASPDQAEMLKEQLGYMQQYAEVLTRRLSQLG